MGPRQVRRPVDLVESDDGVVDFFGRHGTIGWTIDWCEEPYGM